MFSATGRSHRFSRRLILRGLGTAALGAALAPVLAACGTQTSPAATAKPAEPAKPAAAAPAAPAAAPTTAAATGASAAKPAAQSGAAVELRLHVRTGNEADMLSERLPDFEKMMPTTKVKIESFPAAEYFAKVQTLVAGGQLGDVIWSIVHGGWSPFFLSGGVTMPLDDLVAADKFDLSQYYPSSVQAAKVFENKLSGLPFKLQPFAIGLYYNNTAFTEEKVAPPTLDTTIDEFVEIAKKMNKVEGGKPTRFGYLPYQVGTANGGYETLVVTTRSFGGDVTSADGKKATLNSPEAVAGVKWIWDMVFTHKFAPSVQQLGGDPANPQDAMFVAGTGAMYQNGSSAKSLPTRVKDKFEVKNTMLPMGPGKSRGSMAGVDVMMMSKGTKYQKESWELVKLLCDKETGIRLGEGRGGASGTCGARPDSFNDPRLLANPLHQVWIKQAEEAGPLFIPANFRGGEIDTLLKQKLSGLFNGDVKFEQKFFDELNTGVQQILDKPKP